MIELKNPFLDNLVFRVVSPLLFRLAMFPLLKAQEIRTNKIIAYNDGTRAWIRYHTGDP